ncbi:MAG: diguanylate cyclase [Desulfoprunum sp.]|nr:diguanylate cyclase [Desulfoprunum sp.]
MDKAPILIVDDRKENLLTLERLLEGPDLLIVQAHSGQEALTKTLDHDFALILMDVQMPIMDGFETAELLRGNKRTRHIPIIFVTAARMDQEHMFKGYDAGAIDYLLKPLEPAVLKSKIGIFLEMYSQKRLLEQKTRELDAKILELEELQRKLEESNKKLQHLSSVDGLTGLFNRRHFDDIFLAEWKSAVRRKKPMSVIIIDIDNFKAYNDSYGHIAGDICLQQVAKGLLSALHRPIDLVCRYGGEEFTVILPDTDVTGAELVANRMRERIKGLQIQHSSSSTGGYVTISSGISTMSPEHGQSCTVLLDAADKALYRAKAEGRDCCRVNFAPVGSPDSQ